MKILVEWEVDDGKRRGYWVGTIANKKGAFLVIVDVLGGGGILYVKAPYARVIDPDFVQLEAPEPQKTPRADAFAAELPRDVDDWQVPALSDLPFTPAPWKWRADGDAIQQNNGAHGVWVLNPWRDRDTPACGLHVANKADRALLQWAPLLLEAVYCIAADLSTNPRKVARRVLAELLDEANK